MGLLRPARVRSVQRPVKSTARILRWLNQRQPDWGSDPDDYEAVYTRRFADRLRWLFDDKGYFRCEVEGWPNVPETPVVVVSNHSGGSTLIDAAAFVYSWHRYFGFGRPLHVLAHDFLFSQRVTGPALARMGVLRAHRENAMRVLRDEGRDLMVMPGGDRDTWRAWKDRYRVCFYGHRGYARLALETGIPILPVASAGPHETLIVLTQGEGLARRLRLHDLLRIDMFPIHLSLPWGIGVGPLPHLPWPAKFDFRIGAPIVPPRSYGYGRHPSARDVDEHDRKVRHALQGLLDRLALERKSHPVQPHR